MDVSLTLIIIMAVLAIMIGILLATVIRQLHDVRRPAVPAGPAPEARVAPPCQGTSRSVPF